MKVENIINRIIKIDKDALKIKKKTEEIKKENEKKVKEEMTNIEVDIIENAKKESEYIYKSIADEGEVEAKKIVDKGDSICEEIEKIYENEKGKLEEELFTQIFAIKK